MKGNIACPRITGLAGLLAIVLVASGLAYGAQSEVTRGARSTPQEVNKNVKEKSLVNNPAEQPAAPASKGGEKTRGAFCYLHVDNHTPLIIQVFVDSDPVGAVSPWGDAYGDYSSGSRVLYGVATFTDGSQPIFWTTSLDCDGPLIWRLSELTAIQYNLDRPSLGAAATYRPQRRMRRYSGKLSLISRDQRGRAVSQVRLDPNRKTRASPRFR